ncbi:MAG: hypothetical protein COX90_00350 [Candidatus Nealsonbacteria bacterium CG_4_10_14_0_2_um_filter_38_17]|uniref:Uncharacterized protein n=2 Tax=Candidatus Nealsoniibacteriota TaxID=1817911 RepID=A0A2M7UZ38_9BACT|nr:MAG: hypothetical protein COX36_04055 [Candidatus Nealsonbacteria bacterium CG23_combo_of_CG06-09_8_20_14_all_38_19]PIZ89236.1 MAG: hypothetical protein COX90_00350 [Candidatus Nealsonbacteria bacterium CG_4_10_14_0_2_um_filter_38_17]
MKNRKVDMRRRIRAPDPLDVKMAEVLGRIIENPKTANGFQKLVPDVDFLLSYAEDSLEYWRLRVEGLGMEDALVVAIRERIDIQERLGEKRGFSLETLHAMARSIARQAEQLETPKEVEVWISRVRNAREIKTNQQEQQEQNLKLEAQC